jgi:replicative DNA helicase
MPRGDEMLVQPLADREAEQAIIAATFYDNALAVRLELQPEDFSDELLGRLWEIAQTVVARGERFAAGPVMADQPENVQCYVQAIAAAGSLPISAPDCARSVKDLAVRRRLRALGDDLAAEIADTSQAAEQIAARFIGEASRVAVSRRAMDKRAAALEAYEALRAPSAAFSTGIAELDRVMGGGLYPGKLYGLGARKKTGKTTLLGTISHNLNAAGVKHVFLAGEMTPREIEQRNIARAMGFNAMQFLRRQRADLDRLVAEYAASVPNNTIYERAANRGRHDVQRMIANAIVAGARGALVDYLQLIGGRRPNQSQAEHLDETAQMLADMATEHGIFVVVAAQLNQEANVRGGEGLRNACDWYATLHRCGEANGSGSRGEFWLEVEDCRYAVCEALGSDTSAGLWMHTTGPHFSDQPPALVDARSPHAD